jgi:ubiquinone/menaquinone biosynthesis C-methylase UbiE
MSNDVRSTPPGSQEISSPRFAAFYNWLMDRPLVRRGFDPLRCEIVGLAQGVVLEVGAGGGQNFPFYDPTHVVRVEALEPDEAMLVVARRHLAVAPVPITLTRAPVEVLPFPDAQFDTVVVTLVFCSVGDPERGLREIWRVLKPGGTLLMLEHVRAQARMVAWLQDVLVPVTIRCMGHDHWNRDTLQTVLHTGFQTTQVRQLSGGLLPMLYVQANRPQTQEEATAGTE